MSAADRDARSLHQDNRLAWDQAATAYTVDNEVALADLRAGRIGVRQGRWGFTGARGALEMDRVAAAGQVADQLAHRPGEAW